MKLPPCGELQSRMNLVMLASVETPTEANPFDVTFAGPVVYWPPSALHCFFPSVSCAWPLRWLFWCRTSQHRSGRRRLRCSDGSGNEEHRENTRSLVSSLPTSFATVHDVFFLNNKRDGALFFLYPSSGPSARLATATATATATSSAWWCGWWT